MRLDGHSGLLNMVETAGDVADFGQVEVDIAVFVVGHEVVEGESVEVLGKLFGVFKYDFESFLVNA